MATTIFLATIVLFTIVTMLIYNMVKLTPKEYQEKHNKRLKASLDDIRKGVERVSESPMDKAAAKKDKMRTNLLESLDNGKWEDGLKSVSLEDWKSKTLNKGVGRISAGIDEAAEKVVRVAEQLLPAVQSAQDKVKNMPDITLEDNISRASEFMREMSKLKIKKR